MHKMEKIDAGKYKYRGYTLKINEDVSPGYWGRWITGHGRSDLWASTRRSLKRQIDRIEGE